MNWIALLIYLVIGFILAIIFLFLNNKLQIFDNNDYVWSASLVVAWPPFIIFGMFCFIAFIIVSLLKWIDKKFIRRNKS